MKKHFIIKGIDVVGEVIHQNTISNKVLFKCHSINGIDNTNEFFKRAYRGLVNRSMNPALIPLSIIAEKS